MVKKFLGLGVFAIIHAISFGQHIHLDVMMDDKKVGDIEAIKTVKGKSATYELTSNVEATIIFKIKVDAVTKTQFKNGVLEHSTANRTTNIGKENKATTVDINGKQYLIHKGDDTSSIAGPIKFCISNLYFEEPLKLAAAFSEVQALNIPLTDLGSHRYQINQPNGNKDFYVYEKGKLKSIETTIAMKKVFFVVK